jgi:hypothetical protein
MKITIVATAILCIVTSASLLADSGVMTYQGRVQSGGSDFSGTGLFKFALVTSSNLNFITYWSNDGTSINGSEPVDSVSALVSEGLFTVPLGDTVLTNMMALDAGLFEQPDLELRIWFNDGVNGFAALSPVQPLTTAPYSFKAANADTANLAGTVAEGAVGAEHLAEGAAAANLADSGQLGVPSGGMILSEDSDDTNLVTAGYVKLGKVDLGDVWEQRDNGERVGPPPGRYRHTAVWTGSEMILWGGRASTDSLFGNGRRYDPAANQWRPVTGAAARRELHTAVWTGTEMITFGGQRGDGSYLNSGGRYNPVTDSWTSVSSVGAPSTRAQHTAVWTDTEMIIWGGESGSVLNDGGRYDPALDSWTTMSQTNSMTARFMHTAVWAGDEMIVWGGRINMFRLNSGGRYDPAADSWTLVTTTDAPDARSAHTAVWADGEMIIWGGGSVSGYFDDGGRYDPTSDNWTAVSNVGAPGGRLLHTAVWSGSEMIVWGGFDDTYLNTGGRYDPALDSWTAVTTLGTTAGAPSGRSEHTAVWSGSEMIVWGGELGSGFSNDGGRYDPTSDSWTAVSASGVPVARFNHTAVWTGSEMIVWGGHYDNFAYAHLSDGSRYDPVANRWMAVTAAGAPDARRFHTAVWTGTEMIIWGGRISAVTISYFNDGGRYNPATDSWADVATDGAPDGRSGHTAVWTGTDMIIWGGSGDGPGLMNTGGRYHPGSNSWTAVTTTAAPAGRSGHIAVWTDSEMIVWGGAGAVNFYLDTGGRYHPGSNSWAVVTTSDAPVGRSRFAAVWTGSEMIVWGGKIGTVSMTNEGGRYDPATDSWTAVTTTGAPQERDSHLAVWTGSEMIVWGGKFGLINLYTGGRYDPATDNWMAMTNTDAPPAHGHHTAVWAGSEMIVWGGTDFPSPSFNETYSYTPTRLLYLYQKP